ncbi:flavoprotein [Arachidicoccus ginsenosidimutans]|uniref:NAD(P)/FAD-dependent oxidoreductase n=1 Tax=Arachidicoccus sp. BS20 TaxID=1850526 RepID=UPI0007F093C9|nr:NAD(P)/FAD-dependent oxidoreductase [Arachidicoccus sp. BS20]ANI90424.1 flavoprotein [Arachidicoccus sp. BS20]
MTDFNNQKTFIIIGGGAAGFFCAVNAARLSRDLKVVILEKSSKVLSKVKVSGGGRCNVTHHCFDVNELIKKYPRGKNFLKKEFFNFSPKNTVEWFEQRGVQLKTEADGRMFPITDSSQTIIDCLLNEAKKYNVEIRLNANVHQLFKENDNWVIDLGYEKIKADFVCIACGGFPKIEQFSWLKNLEHSIEMPVPSLFTFNIPENNITQLMGISSVAQVKILGTKLVEQAPLLITHWGLSGPAILRLSAWGARILAEKNYEFSIHINWLPQYNEQSLRNDWNDIRNKISSQKIIDKNPFDLPKRLWQYFLSKAEIDEDLYWSKLPSKQQNKLIQILVADEYHIKGKTTFKEEFVTCGGISLSEIDVQTMQSRLHKNLFFAGEILDVDGVTGGFNFQHAWSSGWIAAKTVAANV